MLPSRHAVLPLVAILLAGVSHAAIRLHVLHAAAGLPAHIVGLFRDAVSYQEAGGRALVFDRRAHAVYAVDRGAGTARTIVEIGHESGRIIEPSAFDAEPEGSFVVADAPNNVERLQIFSPTGVRLGGFSLPGKATARVVIAGTIYGGIGSLQFTGRGVYMNLPETGALVTEFGLAGTPTRSIGTLRKTGREADREVHLALNTGLPLVMDGQGFYFVFQAGEPLFRKYDRAGRLVFERHLQGREIDALVTGQATDWPRNRDEASGAVELPLVVPNIQTAAVDPAGRLWVAFRLPYTYIYDADGEKIAVVQFRGATGVITPTSLHFASNGRVLVTPGCYDFVVPEF